MLGVRRVAEFASSPAGRPARAGNVLVRLADGTHGGAWRANGRARAAR